MFLHVAQITSNAIMFAFLFLLFYNGNFDANRWFQLYFPREALKCGKCHSLFEMQKWIWEILFTVISGPWLGFIGKLKSTWKVFRTMYYGMYWQCEKSFTWSYLLGNGAKGNVTGITKMTQFLSLKKRSPSKCLWRLISLISLSVKNN